VPHQNEAAPAEGRKEMIMNIIFNRPDKSGNVFQVIAVGRGKFMIQRNQGPSDKRFFLLPEIYDDPDPAIKAAKKFCESF
jgi:hypothetical protein